MLLEALNALDAAGAEDAEDAEQQAAPPVLSRPQRDALVRALMRSEAALLRKDADRFPGLDRPVEERRSVALVLLAAEVFTTARRLGLAGSPARVGVEKTPDESPPAARAVS